MYKQTAKEQDRRGTALVEMALVLPIFFTVVLGIIEFGRGMMVSQLITNTAREAVRLGITDEGTNDAIEQLVKDQLQTAADVDPNAITVVITVTAAPGNTDPGNDVASAQKGDVVGVRVTVPFNQVAYIAPDFLENATLRSEVFMRHD